MKKNKKKQIIVIVNVPQVQVPPLLKETNLPNGCGRSVWR